jgi:hypothetical protein
MVSNLYMRGVLKSIACCAGTIIAALLGFALLVYSINCREVRTAQRMMEDVAQLQVQASVFADVLALSHKYNGEATGTWHDQPCLESNCLISLAPDKDDFWERHPKLAYAKVRILSNGWRLYILMWVKNGKLSAVEQWFVYLTPKVSTSVITEVSPPNLRLCGNPHYRLHHTFAANPGPKHFDVWVSPSAIQEREILLLNVDCVLRIPGCRGVPDMAPAAWRAYENDQRLIDATEGKPREAPASDSECR